MASVDDLESAFRAARAEVDGFVQRVTAEYRERYPDSPIKSGRRVIFLTLEDTTGLADLAFFEESHATCAATVFHNGLLLVRGTVQRRSKNSTTLV